MIPIALWRPKEPQLVAEWPFLEFQTGPIQLQSRENITENFENKIN